MFPVMKNVEGAKLFANRPFDILEIIPTDDWPLIGVGCSVSDKII